MVGCPGGGWGGGGGRSAMLLGIAGWDGSAAFFEELDAGAEHFADAEVGDVDGDSGDLEDAGDVCWWVALDGGEFEDLELEWGAGTADAVEGGGDDVLLPFCVPCGVELGHGWVFEVGDGGGVEGDDFVRWLFAVAAAEDVCDAAARDGFEPCFEAALGAVVFEVGHFFGDAEDGVLDGVLSFLVVEA